MPLFELRPSVGRLRYERFRRLISAQALLYGTIEDDYIGFLLIALCRALLGKRTVGLFLRPQTCFSVGDDFRLNLKGYFFWILKCISNISVGTIVPFEIAPHYAQVARFGVMDPQMWDRDGRLRDEKDLNLEAMVCRHSRGRQILAFLGTASAIKGIDFLAALMSRSEWCETDIFTVVAGKVDAEISAKLRNLPGNRVMLIDRFISNAELNSLYGLSDYIWACYRPDYDQASGIFGRAIQFGKTPVVRRGSLIDSMALQFNVEAIRLEYDDLTAKIERPSRAFNRTSRDSLTLEKKWRDQFIETIDLHL